MSNSKTLSVLLSSYNYAHFLHKSLGAILSQSYRPLEIIILDDGSTDNSVSIIREMIINCDNVIFIEKKENQGPMATATEMLFLSRGDYVYSAAADDYILPGFLEKSMALLEKNPEAGLCFTDIVQINSKTREAQEYPLHLSRELKYFTPKELGKIFKKRIPSIMGNSIVYKRSAVIESGGWIEDLLWQSDWFSTLVILFREGACYVPEVLAVNVQNPNSFSASGSKKKEKQYQVLMEQLRLLSLEKYEDVVPFFKKSAVLSVNGFDVLFSIVKGRYWDFLSVRLVYLVLKKECFSLVRRMSPKRFISFYRGFREYCMKKKLADESR